MLNEVITDVGDEILKLSAVGALSAAPTTILLPAPEYANASVDDPVIETYF